MKHIVLVFKDPSWLYFTNDDYHAVVVHDIQFVDRRALSSFQMFNRHGKVIHHQD